MSTSALLTASDVARRLNVDRRTVAAHAKELQIGVRAGSSPTAPILLSESEIEQISESIQKKATEFNFKPGNDLWKLREKSQKKRQKGK